MENSNLSFDFTSGPFRGKRKLLPSIPPRLGSQRGQIEPIGLSYRLGGKRSVRQRKKPSLKKHLPSSRCVSHTQKSASVEGGDVDLCRECQYDVRERTYVSSREESSRMAEKRGSPSLYLGSSDAQSKRREKGEKLQFDVTGGNAPREKGKKERVALPIYF